MFPTPPFILIPKIIKQKIDNNSILCYNIYVIKMSTPLKKGKENTYEKS